MMLQRNQLADLPEGAADNFKVGISAMELNSGNTVNLASPGVTAIVGANNVGKSTLLRELYQGLSGHFDTSKILRSIDLIHEGSVGDALAWMSAHCTSESRPSRGGPGFVRPGSENEVMPTGQIAEWWNRGHKRNSPPSLGNLTQFFAMHAEAGARQQFVNGHGARADIGERSRHPMHVLQDSSTLQQELTNLSMEIFRVPLTLDALSGTINLRVGSVEVPAPKINALTSEYLTALTELPRLSEQGDGMKSLLGLLIPVVCATYPILFVDEPEAFLHPPQAVALGSALAKLATQKSMQVILATHDKNFLAGVLESEADVSVVKLDRRDGNNYAHQLSNEQLRSLWSDPVLRYSNALDGLFHKLVVLMEGDRDCKFFSAAFDHATLPLPPSEVLFVPSGGKAGMAKVARSLRAIDVPVVASPDLDILNDAAVLKQLVESLGGNWQDYESDYRKATEPFRQPGPKVTSQQVLSAVNTVLGPLNDAVFDESTRNDVRAAMRLGESPWKAVKQHGISAFRAEARQAADSLLTSLARIGLVPLQVGELENLAPALGVAKGPAWLPAALESGTHNLPATQSHVGELIAAFTTVTAVDISTTAPMD